MKSVWVFGDGTIYPDGTSFQIYQYTRSQNSSKLCSHLKLGYEVDLISLPTRTGFGFIEKRNTDEKGFQWATLFYAIFNIFEQNYTGKNVCFVFEQESGASFRNITL